MNKLNASHYWPIGEMGIGLPRQKISKKICHGTIRNRYKNGSATLHVIYAPMSLNSLYLASGPGAQKF